MSDIQNIRLNKVEVKLADTDDPVALKISWDLVKRGGSNFKSQKMKMQHDKILIDKSVSAVVLYSFFIVPGFLWVAVGTPYHLLKGDFFAAIFFLIWGRCFAVLVCYFSSVTQKLNLISLLGLIK